MKMGRLLWFPLVVVGLTISLYGVENLPGLLFCGMVIAGYGLHKINEDE